MNTPIRIIGMAWYKAEDYDACRRIMSDRDKFTPNFHIWLMGAEQGEKKLRREGYIVVRAFIDSKTFPDWCRARGLDIDAKARTEFSATAAHEAATARH